MKFQVENPMRIKPCFLSIFITYLFLCIKASHQNITCPFQYLYQFGDGITDIGNSIRLVSSGTFLPAAHLPYGETFPGQPTGRWSDGRIDIDFIAGDVGLANIVPYLSMNASIGSYNAVTFSVASSPTLDNIFFTSRGIDLPPYVVPLSGQLTWFKTYLKSICSTQQDCVNKHLANSLIILGDIEGNDIGYPLTQGKSIKEVTTYVPFIIEALTDATRELIGMGATRIVVAGSVPLGCYPYILTALETNQLFAYDDLGCLNSVNNLIVSKNLLVLEATIKLAIEYPNAEIFYGDIYIPLQTVLRQASNPFPGPQGNMALKACCGIGGKYNYDSTRLCGSPGVPVCANPNNYIYWDGLHFTQQTYARYTDIVAQLFLPLLKCTST